MKQNEPAVIAEVSLAAPIARVKEPTLLRYGWRYEGWEGNAVVTFELTETEAGTDLRLTHEVLEDFQDGVPEFSRDNCVGAWDYFLKQRLMALMAG